MKIDVQIARRAHPQVDQAVPRQLLEHMIEKADSGLDIVIACAVEIDRHRNVCFAGLPRDGCRAAVLITAPGHFLYAHGKLLQRLSGQRAYIAGTGRHCHPIERCTSARFRVKS